MRNTVLVTGSAGLIGSETARFFHAKGYRVVGIDYDMRKVFFGAGASTDWNRCLLQEQLKSYRPDDLALSISGNALNSLGEIDFNAAPDPQATSQTELTLNKTRNSKLLFETRWSIGTVGTKTVITVATRKASGSPIALKPLSLKVVVAP